MKAQASIAQNSPIATLTQVNQNAASVSLLAAKSERLGAIIVNNSAANLYVAFAAAASTTAFTYKVAAGGTLEIPMPAYGGAISGIWDAAGAGTAVITELS